MTDDIKELERALANERLPEPGRAAKKRALELAMAAFDEKNANTHQGSGPLDRLKDTAWAVYETLIGRRSMKLTPAFAGGASLAVLTLAVLSATYIQTTGPDFGIGRQTAPTQLPPRTAGRDDKAETTMQPGTPVAENEAAPQRALKQEHDRIARSNLADRQASAQEPRARAMPPAAEALSRLGAAVESKARAGRDQAGVRRLAVKPKQDRPAGSYYRDQGRDKFETITQNPVKLVTEEPVSTFSIDVDTASYAFIRASLNNNVLPQKDAVRVEEMINYFPYDYAKPDDKSVPFKASVSVLPSPWKAERKLVHIGIAGFELKRAERPQSNLVFLLDTSGSMNAPNKLPLVINSMKLLLDSLGPDDTVAIVTYAGNAGTVLEPTRVKEKAKILQAFNNLHAGGSTAGAEGIRQAYELAKQNVKKDGVNRVILATDGDFNVGITNREELKSYVERQRKTGISLSVLGFGRGNYNDALMQTLAQNGNGNAAYIDTLNEARKVLVEEAGSTLFTIAKDVKLQLEFNPQAVSEYRLIGYETRLLNREDFNNDKVDAGDIGAGHTVTAIYEITPAGSASALVDPLRYQGTQKKPSATGKAQEYGFLKIRYKLPDAQTSKLITTPVSKAREYATINAAPVDARFATSVAAFGQLLRGGRYTGSYSYDDVIALAQSARGTDEFGYRADFINLVRLARSAPPLPPLKRR